MFGQLAGLGDDAGAFLVGCRQLGPGFANHAVAVVADAADGQQHAGAALWTGGAGQLFQEERPARHDGEGVILQQDVAVGGAGQGSPRQGVARRPGRHRRCERHRPGSW